MNNQNQNRELTEACIYFSTSFPIPLKQSRLEECLTILQKSKVEILAKSHIENLIIERYYEIVKNYSQLKLEEFLIIRLILLLEKIIKVSQNSEQELIIIIWTCVSHLKKCTPEPQHKEIIKTVLNLISTVTGKLLKLESFKPESMYPQLSASLMHFVLNCQLNHVIFGKILAIMGELLAKIFQNRIPQPFLNFTENKDKPISFESQCLPRLQAYLKAIINKIPRLELTYYQPLSEFALKLWPVSQKYISLLCPVAIIAQLTETQLDYTTLSSSLQKLIYSSITNQFLTILNTHHTNLLQRQTNLKKLYKLSRLINPSPQQSTQILLKFTNSLYLVQNTNTKVLIVPHINVAQSADLVQLTSRHSFANYNIGLDAMLSSFNSQVQRILLHKLPYAESSLSNITLLKKIATNLPSITTSFFTLQLLEAISNQEGQYMIDMSLTKFCQFVTKILVLYWLITTPNYYIPSEIALNILQVLSGSQAIRILQPTFEEEEILIGLTLMICYQCYNSLIRPPKTMNGQQPTTPPLTPIEKLKLKLTLLQTCLNNISQQSYLIRCSAYYILLSEAAPQTIGQALSNLQTTLINRNINNVQFVIALLMLGELSETECEDLADKFMRYGGSGSEELLRVLLPRLKSETVRKCVLGCTEAGAGKWVHMLRGNTTLLYKKAIQNKQQPQSKLDNFSMNDGPNVQISNALGVILLQLGSQWQHVLHKESPNKDIALDLLIELVGIDCGMVFFRGAFVGVLRCLEEILGDGTGSLASERRRRKVYKILALIPDVNYKIYKQHLDKEYQQKTQQKNQSKKTKKQPEPHLLTLLLKNIEARHKKYQLNYLTNPKDPEALEMYDNSDNIIRKLTQALNTSEQEPK